LFTVERCGVPGRNARDGVRIERFRLGDEPEGLLEQVAVKVTLDDGAWWIGVFESGRYTSPIAVEFELVAWPDGKSFCVVTGAAGYVVRADLAGGLGRIACFPITAVRALPELGLVVFLDFTSVVAYDATRTVWESPRLAYDELEIVGVNGSKLRLRGWNAPERRLDEMTLDLRTGMSTDGFYPADAPRLGDLNLRRS
jgi:hypothetical protein